MRLKSLEMIGFKSFVDRTVVHFEEGITGVVGPNGCGKSNIVDAIRWVMGEMSAKHLRGSEMQDVIFNGAETRQPVGMAQVFLTFDNSDGRAPAEYAHYNEIQIGRRLYRSGESEYFINKTLCRLRDIIDLFLGTGVGTKAYSVVEQGMIGSIVSAKPEDRRLLIEEAAGISKFKSRKEAALRKMEATRINLARLSDVTNELSRQMNSLHRQVKKAERYQHLSEELRTRELAVAATRYHKLRLELEELQSDNSRLSEAELARASELATCETEIEKQKMDLASIDRELDGTQQELYTVRNNIKLSEADIQHKTKEIDSIRERRVAATQEMEEFKERLSTFGEKLELLNQQQVDADIELEASHEKVTQLSEEVAEQTEERDQAEEFSDEQRESLYEAQSSISKAQSKLEHLEQRKQEIDEWIGRNRTEITTIDEQLRRSEGDVVEVKENLQQVNQIREHLLHDAAELRRRLEEERSALTEGEERLQELKGHLQDRNSRHESLVELAKSLDGYRDGVRSILKRSQKGDDAFEGVVGTVGELIDTDLAYEQAVGAVLGERLQYVVVQSHEQGVTAIDYLKTEATGRGSFIPIDVYHNEERSIPTGDGVIGPMVELVRMSDDHRKIAQYLFGDVVLVEDLNRALSLWKERPRGVSFATLSGEVVDPFGVVTGGSQSDLSGRIIAQKRKIEELEEEIEDLRREVADASADVARKREELANNEECLNALTNEAHSEELKALGLERDLERLRNDVARAQQEQQQLTEKIAELEREKGDREEERKTTSTHRDGLSFEKEQRGQKLAQQEEVLQRLESALETKEQALINIKVAHGQAKERQGAIEREVQNLLNQRTETELGIGRRQAEIKKGEGDIIELKSEIEHLKKNLELSIGLAVKLEETQRTLQERYEGEKGKLQQYELSMRQMRKQHEEALQATHEVELKLTEHKGRMEYLVEGIRERYRSELPNIEHEYLRDDEEFNIDTETAVVEEIKEKIEKIGAVNVDALQEYEELKERYDFLTQQHSDLIASLDGLEKAIAKINRTSRTRFKETFDAVDRQFQMLFPKLFRGGAARLVLTNKDDLLETGVEIVASPPGKKLQSITLLSGGEKALTAVALIFSIFLIKPSPFCLLDEVDAPLDDANIDRFNDLIRGMTPHSQFILITHNKRTMELADLLYGVTMEEAGVSKMVSVKLNQDVQQPEPAVA